MRRETDLNKFRLGLIGPLQCAVIPGGSAACSFRLFICLQVSFPKDRQHSFSVWSLSGDNGFSVCLLSAAKSGH